MNPKGLLLYILVLLSGYSICQDDDVLFSIIASDQSGIKFSNNIIDTRAHNILLYSNYYGGAGVAISDLDGDGLQDIYFAGNLVQDRLYKNLGGFKFEDVTQAAGILDNGSWSSSVLIGDVNNDGLPDIYVTTELYDDPAALRANMLYINQGGMKFKERSQEYKINNMERTRGATFIDYDKDGFMDLYLLNQPPNPGNYSKYSGTFLLQDQWSPRLYKNILGQYFEDVSLQAGVLKPGYANAVVAADINNDGWPDLYVSNDYNAPDFVWMNNQDGTFSDRSQESLAHMSYYSMGVDVADINNDGLLDIMTLDMVAEDNYRQKANMGGMYPEAFWKLVDNGGHYQYMYNTLQLNQGDERFGNIAQLAGVSNTDWSWSNLIADFDNDGWKDIHVTNGLLRDIRNSDIAQEFPQKIRQIAAEYLDSQPKAKEVPIMDIMDIEEVLNMHPSVPLSNYAFRNNSDLTFDKVSVEWGLDQRTFSNGSAYGDLDNDGDLDLVISNINDEALLYKNNAQNNFIRLNLIDDLEHKATIGTKVEMVSKQGRQYVESTTARGMYSTSEAYIHFGIGSDTRVDTLIVTWPDGTSNRYVDIKANQLLDILKSDAKRTKVSKAQVVNNRFRSFTAADIGLDYIHRENEFDDFKRQILLPHKMSQFGPAVAIGDVNADGLEDVYIGGATGQAASMYFQNHDGSFAEQAQSFESDAAYEDVDAILVDYDRDGDLDLYVVSGGNSSPSRNKNYLDRLYTNDGYGRLVRNHNDIPRVLESGSCVRAADYDGDGDQDLFIGGRHNPWDYPSPSISRILRNEGDQYIDVTKKLAKELIFNGLVTDAIWSDYNADGRVDLVLVGEWMPITFYQNTPEGFLLDTKVSIYQNGQSIKTNGWWNHIAQYDIDGDGDQDFLCGNLGKNYKYKASQREPFEVHYDDFDGNGHKDIVLSYYNFGTRFPLRGRSCSMEQIPDIQKKFPSYNLFAQAALSEIYDPMGLEQSLHLEAFLFDNIILVNQGNGSYELESLPNEMQLSSINCSAMNEEYEILTAGNMSQAEIETPKNDASVGAILSYAHGQVMVQTSEHTGIYLPQDVRKIKNITIKGQQHWLVATNNGSIELIKKTRPHKQSVNDSN